VLGLRGRNDDGVNVRVGDDFEIVRRMEIGTGLLRKLFGPSRVLVRDGEKIYGGMSSRHRGAKSANSPRSYNGDANLLMAHA